MIRLRVTLFPWTTFLKRGVNPRLYIALMESWYCMNGPETISFTRISHPLT